jgi:hypothetical protein
MKKSRTARKLKRRMKTRKGMRGGEINKPVNKDVIDALKAAADSMITHNKYPQLQKSFEKLIRVSETDIPHTADADASTVNAAASTVNADASSTVNNAPSTDSSTVNNAPSTDSSTVNADASTDSSTVNAVATNEPKAELTEKSVIYYGDSGKQFSTYFGIKNTLGRMINKPKTMNQDNIPIETLKSRLEEITNAKTIPEVTAILQKYKFNDTHPKGRPAFSRFAMTMGGGSRKHKMRKIKNQYTSK